MIESIIKAIAAELGRVYPEVPKRYITSIECGFKAPAFYIHAIQPTHKAHLFGQFTQEYLIEVIYFAFKDKIDSRKMIFDLYEKAEELPQVLRYIPYEDKQLVGQIGSDGVVWQDDTLHVMVKYRAQSKYSDNTPKMQTQENKVISK